MSIENPTSPRINELRIGLLSEKKNPTQEELASLKEEIIKETNAKKRFELQKKLVRLERFDSLSEGKGLTDPKQKEAAEKVLKGKNFESVRNSDLLTLKKRGIDIASLVLVDTVSPERDITSSTLKTGDSFKVNFGKNINLDKRTGAGDILPTNIRTIKINGIECERRNVPRPGYYNDSMKPAYQDIHDGDSIEILTLGNETSEDVIANEKQWRKERVNDVIDFNKNNPFTDLDEDVGLFSDMVQENEKRKELAKKYGENGGEKTFRPNSPECISLFKDACNWAGINESWASQKSLHTILGKESNGEIGRLNYTLKNIKSEEFKSLALNGEKIPAKSSASGLGQLLLSNVDMYYPSGRNGIGNPFEEAVGMIKYIADRYGSPDIAMSVYGKVATYQHGITGKSMTKGFQEGY